MDVYTVAILIFFCIIVMALSFYKLLNLSFLVALFYYAKQSSLFLIICTVCVFSGFFDDLFKVEEPNFFILKYVLIFVFLVLFSFLESVFKIKIKENKKD